MYTIKISYLYLERQETEYAKTIEEVVIKLLEIMESSLKQDENHQEPWQEDSYYWLDVENDKITMQDDGVTYTITRFRDFSPEEYKILRSVFEDKTTPIYYKN